MTGMNDKIFPYVPKDILLTLVSDVIRRVQRAENKAVESMFTNVVDPFSALFDASRQGLHMDDWLAQERARQIQKTLQNALGGFHQDVLGSIEGWHNAGKGGSYDVGNETEKIIAEIKTKFNTMNSSSAPGTYRKLADHLQYSHKGYTAYLVEIIPRNPRPYNSAWSPNLRQYPKRDDIKRIDGRSFYELATGDPEALLKLYRALPTLIQQILGAPARRVEETPLFEDLYYKVYGKS